MSITVMTVHTFNHSYPGFSAVDYQSSSCDKFLLPARRPGKLFMNETGNRHSKSYDAKRFRELWQQVSEICGDGEVTVVDLDGHRAARTYIHKRGNPNSHSNEVNL